MQRRHDRKESAEDPSKGQPKDPAPSHAYKIAKWTNMSTEEGSKLSKVPVDPSSGKPISLGYKTVKWTDVCPAEGTQISDAAPMDGYKLVKWTDMSRPHQSPQLPSREYNVVKWTNASSEGSQLIKAPVDLGGYKVLKWTSDMPQEHQGGTPDDASNETSRDDYKIVKWVDMTPKDESLQRDAPTVSHPSCDRNMMTVETAASEGLQPSAEEIIVDSDGVSSSDGYKTYFKL